MEIKVCGMRNPENVRQLCQLPISYIGFIFHPQSSRFVGEDFDVAVTRSVPKGIKKVGVFVDATPEYVLSKVDKYDLECVQFHGKENPAFCEFMKNELITTIKAFGVDDTFDFRQILPYRNACDYILFDTKSPVHGGTGNKFNWDVLRAYIYDMPVFLSGGISVDDVDAIKKLEWLNIKAVDINSKFETQPAMKDIEAVKKFVAGIKG